MSQRIRIVITPNSNGTRVYLDDVEIKDLTSITVDAAVDTPSRLTFTMIAKHIEIEGEIGTTVRDVTSLTSIAREWRAQ